MDASYAVEFIVFIIHVGDKFHMQDKTVWNLSARNEGKIVYFL